MSETVRTCPNCGSPRPDRFCASCGQSDRHYLRATWNIVAEAIRESLDLDSRLARTASALLLRPGTLTREFFRGRRASYVSPVRLYLVVSIVFFAVLSLTSRFETESFATTEDGQSVQLGSDDEIDRMYIDLNDVQRQRVRGILDKQGLVDDALRQRLDEIDATPATRSRPIGEMESALHDRALDLMEDPRGIWDGIIQDLPIAMFLTLPLYAGWLKLMYRRHFYAEHLVFALHLHAFLFFVGTFILLLPEAVPDTQPRWLQGLALVGVVGNEGLKLVAAVYYLLALRAVYGEGLMRTLGKFVIINVGHMIFIGLGVAFAAVIAFVAG